MSISNSCVQLWILLPTFWQKLILQVGFLLVEGDRLIVLLLALDLKLDREICTSSFLGNSLQLVNTNNLQFIGASPLPAIPWICKAVISPCLCHCDGITPIVKYG